MKILIWDKGLKLKDVGGPVGYMYKIHKHLESSPCDDIIFYSDYFPTTNKSRFQQFLSGEIGLREVYNYVLSKILPSGCRKLYFKYIASSSLNKKELELLNKVDVVHFHGLYIL